MRTRFSWPSKTNESNRCENPVFGVVDELKSKKEIGGRVCTKMKNERFASPSDPISATSELIQK